MSIKKGIIYTQIALIFFNFLRIFLIIQDSNFFIMFWILSYVPWIILLIIFESAIRSVYVNKSYNLLMIVVLLINIVQIHIPINNFDEKYFVLITLIIVNIALLLALLYFNKNNPNINSLIIYQRLTAKETELIQNECLEALDENHHSYSIYRSNKYGFIIIGILLLNVLGIQDLKKIVSYEIILLILSLELLVLHHLNVNRLRLICTSKKKIIIDNISILLFLLILLGFELLLTPNEKVFSPPLLIILIFVLYPFLDSFYKNSKNIRK